VQANHPYNLTLGLVPDPSYASYILQLPTSGLDQSHPKSRVRRTIIRDCLKYAMSYRPPGPACDVSSSTVTAIHDGCNQDVHSLRSTADC
jgi:hypothetical protein